MPTSTDTSHLLKAAADNLRGRGHPYRTRFAWALKHLAMLHPEFDFRPEHRADVAELLQLASAAGETSNEGAIDHTVRTLPQTGITDLEERFARLCAAYGVKTPTQR
jgi:hypothetical protein